MRLRLHLLDVGHPRLQGLELLPVVTRALGAHRPDREEIAVALVGAHLRVAQDLRHGMPSCAACCLAPGAASRAGPSPGRRLAAMCLVAARPPVGDRLTPCDSSSRCSSTVCSPAPSTRWSAWPSWSSTRPRA